MAGTGNVLFCPPPPEIIDAIVILSDQVSYIYWMWHAVLLCWPPILVHCCSVLTFRGILGAELVFNRFAAVEEPLTGQTHPR